MLGVTQAIKVSEVLGFGTRLIQLVATASGEDLLVEAPSTGTLLVNGTEAETVDIFASNGKHSFED